MNEVHAAHVRTISDLAAISTRHIGHSMTEKELSMRPNPHEDGETIAEEDVEEEEAGEVEKEVTVIPPRLKITKPSKDESNTSNEPRKKRTLRNQPPPGKDIHEYVKEKKDAPQKDESGMCAYCGFGPHKAKACSYLAEVPPTHWTSSPHVWNYSIALRSEGESYMAITAAAHPSDRFNSWLLDTGSDKTPTHSFEDFYRTHSLLPATTVQIWSKKEKNIQQ